MGEEEINLNIDGTIFGDMTYATIKDPEPFKIIVNGQEYSLEQFNDLGTIVKNLSLNNSQKFVLAYMLDHDYDDAFEIISKMNSQYEEEMMWDGVLPFQDNSDKVSRIVNEIGYLDQKKMNQVLLAYSLQKLKDIENGRY